MTTLFIKICIISICIIILGLIAQFILNRFVKNKSKTAELQPLIKRRIFNRQFIHRAVKNYIPQAFVTESSRQNPDDAPPPKNLTKGIELFIQHASGARFLLLLGDSGEGKSTFLLNYFLYNLSKPPKKRSRIFIVPLNLPDADRMIDSISDKAGSVLFLDGLDEDLGACKNPHHRIAEIINLTRDFKRVLITCQINFIPKIKHGPVKPGFETIGNVNDEKGSMYELKKIYLSSLTIPKARQSVESGLSFWQTSVSKQIMAHIQNYPNIGINHLTLSYLGDIFPDHINIISRTDFYKAVIKEGMTFETHWKNKSELARFLNLLAVEIFTGRFQRDKEAVTLSELNELAIAWGIELKPFKNRERSLIYKDDSDNMTFGHRSFMEYLFVEQLINGNKACRNHILTPAMKTFFIDFIKARQLEALETELLWLSGYQLTGHGLSMKSGNSTGTDIFQALLSKKPSHRFLGRLTKLLANPIFYEFGWDIQLCENLKKAFQQSKKSLLKLSSPRRVLTIDASRIEISRLNDRKYKILINPGNYEEYISLETDQALQTLNRSIGLQGLKILASINRSKKIAVLPDLKNFTTFTVYFFVKSEA